MGALSSEPGSLLPFTVYKQGLYSGNSGRRRSFIPLSWLNLEDSLLPFLYSQTKTTKDTISGFALLAFASLFSFLGRENSSFTSEETRRSERQRIPLLRLKELCISFCLKGTNWTALQFLSLDKALNLNYEWIKKKIKNQYYTPQNKYKFLISVFFHLLPVSFKHASLEGPKTSVPNNVSAQVFLYLEKN